MTSKIWKTLSPAWRRALPALLLGLVAVLLLYWDTARTMVAIWDRSETYAHAFVVPPIVLWLIWRQRAVLAAQTPRPSPLFLWPIAAMALLWLLGELVAVNAATQLAFTAMLVLVVPATLGWSTARCIAFPLGFLFFAVPIGEFMTPQLMEWTADFTIAALRLSGVPVYREGLQFVIPSGNWSVVEACSGIRYLIASVMVGTLFAYLNYNSLKRRLIFIGVSIVLPLAANWLRAYLIVMLGHLSSNKLATGADHLVYGWVLFGLIMLALFMIGARWAEPAATPAPAERLAASGVPASRWPMLLVLALLIAAPPLIVQALEAESEAQTLQLAPPDLAAQAWQRAEPSGNGFKPQFRNPAAELNVGYQRAGGAEVGLYIGYYRQQSYQSKLISSSNVLYSSNDAGWVQVAQGWTTEQGRAWRTAELRGAHLGAGQDARRLRVWQLYWVNGRYTSSDWLAKLYGAFGRLSGQGDDAAVLIIYADKTETAQDEALLATFARDNMDGLSGWLSGVRDRARHAQGQSTNFDKGMLK